MVYKSELNPLKKWVLVNKYFIKTTDTKEKKASATHFLLDGGIWKIPKEEYQTFLRLLSADLQNNEKYYRYNTTSSYTRMCFQKGYYLV